MISGLAVEDLAIRRGERLLFENLTFRASAGEAIALIGRNGAGKTSLLRAVAGLLRPAAGTVRFEGAEDAADARSRDLHLIGHHDGLKGGRTAREELAFAASWSGGDAAGLARAAEALDLGRLLDLEVRKLSAGQRRRVGLARLVAAPRALWLLDEPLAPLDSVWRERIGGLLKDHLADGGMLLAAVHDPLPVPARAVEIGA
ncbi:MAG: heme ABC exporter ATP-binding protein CcmA [Caulobacter sp.]